MWSPGEAAAVACLRLVAGLEDPTDEQLAQGDLDGNGVLAVTDALIILRHAAGL